MNNKYKYLIIISLIVLSFIAFGRILGNDFIYFDDDAYIIENDHIKSGININTIKWAFGAVFEGNWHPLTLLSHALDWSIFGANASGHHLISLLLHIGAVLFLFLFLNKTTKSLWPSAFAAAFFALHPLRVESVAWAAERKDVLSMFFGMAALYVYAFYVEDNKISKYFSCLILFVLSLMSKPMLVTLPFVMLLLDYWPLGRWQKALNPPQKETEQSSVSKPQKKKKGKKSKTVVIAEKKLSAPVKDRRQLIANLLWEKAPFILLAIISSIVTLWAQSKGGAIIPFEHLPFSERVINAINVCVAYLEKIFWPVDLAIFYPYEASLLHWKIFCAAFILIGITATTVYTSRKAPFLFVGWFWYIGTLIPVIGLVQVGRQAMADRYTYLPSIGIAMMLTWGLLYLVPKIRLRKIIFLPAAGIVITVLTILTWQQSGCWKDSISVFNHALDVTKNNYLAHTNLGIALAAENNYSEAVFHYRSALQIKPNEDTAHYNLANVLQKQGNTEEAIFHYREAVKSNPNYSKAHNNLGVNLGAQGLYDEAIYHYHQALKSDPENPGIYFNLGMALVKKGALQEAIESFQKAIYLNPNYEHARLALHRALEIEHLQKR
jgi:tetratricopeptide (TPR) repeat protein